MRTEEGDKIFDIIRQHLGAENAVTSVEICHALHRPATTERAVRRIIADESMFWDQLVCAKGGNGYFIATDIEDVLRNWSWLSDLAERAEQRRDAFEAFARKMGFNLKGMEEKTAA